jgi:deoxycytidine triphosphate deaminase
MSIKSDKWIRRMAKATGMIEPFEPGPGAESDGRKIVSYGTSSYGYDIRCSREFKIFTNINSTIVDPKALTPDRSSISRATSASSRRTRSRWHGRWSSSAFRATYSRFVSGNRRTHAAELS